MVVASGNIVSNMFIIGIIKENIWNQDYLGKAHSLTDIVFSDHSIQFMILILVSDSSFITHTSVQCHMSSFPLI